MNNGAAGKYNNQYIIVLHLNLVLHKRRIGMGKDIRTEAVKEMFKAILTLKNEEECFAFFEDVCTVNELLTLAQRYEVAKMLTEGHTYLEVAEETGASTATISRVNRSLNYGGGKGYEIVFGRLKGDREDKG